MHRLVRCRSNSCLWMCGDMLTPRHLARREDDSDHNSQRKVIGVAPYQLEGRWDSVRRTEGRWESVPRHLVRPPRAAEDERVKSADSARSHLNSYLCFAQRPTVLASFFLCCPGRAAAPCGLPGGLLSSSSSSSSSATRMRRQRLNRQHSARQQQSERTGMASRRSEAFCVSAAYSTSPTTVEVSFGTTEDATKACSTSPTMVEASFGTTEDASTPDAVFTP